MYAVKNNSFELPTATVPAPPPGAYPGPYPAPVHPAYLPFVQDRESYP